MNRSFLQAGCCRRAFKEVETFLVKAAHQEKQGELKRFIIAYKYFAPFVNFLFLFLLCF